MTINREDFRPAFEIVYRSNAPDECRAMSWIFDKFDESGQIPGEYIELRPRYAFEGFILAIEMMTGEQALERGAKEISSQDAEQWRAERPEMRKAWCNRARAVLLAAATVPTDERG
jgi:hypothetical protein